LFEKGRNTTVKECVDCVFDTPANARVSAFGNKIWTKIMKPNDKIARWKRKRAKGTLYFIVVDGLYFGISFAVLFSLLQYILPKFFPERKVEHFFEPEFLLTFVGASLAGGFIWSTIAWCLIELDYQNHIGNKELKNFKFWIPRQTNKLK
jgi:hypothetical protein